MNVKESIQKEVADLRAKADALEAKLAELPTEVHSMEEGFWSAIKKFFGAA
jgi:hypothetical protein